MRIIDVSKPEKLKRITALSYGHSRSGKTRFAGSWPRPLFLSDATESGWTTLSNMSKDALFEANRAPQVWAIEKVTDMFQALKDCEPQVKRGDIQTVVVDSLTFYQDLFLNFMERASSNRIDQRQLFGKLAAHLKELREQVHLLNTNVVWLALAKDPGEDQPVGGPMLTGQNAAKFAAGCDYLLYHRSVQPTNAPLQWEVRTRKFGAYAAGGRDEGLLPDPLGYYADDGAGNTTLYTDCTYRTLAEALGILAPPAGDEVVPIIDPPAAEPPPATNGKPAKAGVIARPAAPITTSTPSGRSPR